MSNVGGVISIYPRNFCGENSVFAEQPAQWRSSQCFLTRFHHRTPLSRKFPNTFAKRCPVIHDYLAKWIECLLCAEPYRFPVSGLGTGLASSPGRGGVWALSLNSTGSPCSDSSLALPQGELAKRYRTLMSAPNALVLKMGSTPYGEEYRESLKKLKIELVYDLAISLLGIYPEKTIIRKDTCTPMFIAALFTINSQDMEAT